MSKNYARAKRYYDMGLWTLRMVYNVVGHWITPEEFELITGEVYVAPDGDE